jgi:hypothetical protein
MLSNQRQTPGASPVLAEEKLPHAAAAASHPSGLIPDAVEEEKNTSPCAGYGKSPYRLRPLAGSMAMRSSPPESRNATKPALWVRSERRPEVISTAALESIAALIEFSEPRYIGALSAAEERECLASG